MKSSLATRKFDRLFSSNERKQQQPSNIVDQQNRQQQQQQNPNPKSTDSGDRGKVVIKEVRWKLDDLELGTTARSRQLEEGRRRVEVALKSLQTSLLQTHKLSLEDEALKELQEHYLDLLKSSSGGGDGKRWRENHLLKMKESPGGGGGGGFKKTGEKFEETLGSVLASLERFGRPQTVSSFSIMGGDEEEKKVAAGGGGGHQFNNSTEVKRALGMSTKGSSSSWQFWFWRSDQRFLKWDSGLQKLGTPFQTVRQMRELLGQLLEVHEVALPSDYSVFREGVKPTWEDVANREGGEWSLEFARGDVALVAAIWRRLLEFIFEGGEEGVLLLLKVHHICGLKIGMRFKAYQLSVWTGPVVDLEKTLQVGVAVQRTIADLVGRVSPSFDQQQLVLHYRVHKSALVKEQKKRSLCHSGGGGGGGNHLKMF
ncbi:translation initiation factor eIF4E [Tyrophagus putrescentiae]|nr:translation initiation factor eIF4E [Tyrophagus putrescentiae]